MKYFFLLIMPLMIISCSSGLKRTKETDKSRRVMVDPSSLDERQHAGLQNSLVQSGEFYVVDRSKGYAAIKKEQERLHKDLPDRFEDKQKYAHWGKMYGVGAVIVGHQQCGRNDYNILVGILHMATLGMFHNSHVCNQYLDLIDSNTGEIITSIKSTYKTDQPEDTMDWNIAVDQLISAYPIHFVTRKKHQELESYEQISGENSQRTREAASENN